MANFDYEVDIPGKGKFRVSSPSELSDAQAYRAAAGQADMLDKADPTKGMSTGEKGRAGFAKAFVDLARGGAQFGETQDLILPSAGKIRNFFGQKSIAPEIDQEIAESRQRDTALMNTTAGKVGNFSGNVAATVPTFFVPGANTYTGSALVGGGLGLLQPTTGNESRAFNTAVGAGSGMAGQALGNTIGRVLKPVQSPAPQTAALAAEAQTRNIPLTAAQITGSRPLKIAESVMENMPLTAGPQLAQRQVQQNAFNRAVGKTFGSADEALTPEVLGSARTRIGQKFSDLAGRNTLQADDALMSGLAQIDDNARKYLTPDVGRVVLNRLDDVMSRIENGTMTGKAYRNLDSELGRAARGTANGDLRNALGELRGTLRDAMDRSISGADEAAWKEARRQYASLMTVAPVAAKSETGDVSGKTLLAAANAANKNAKFGSPSELATLGRIGRAFVADQIPNSGTAQRHLVQSLLTGGGGTVLGGAGAAATGNDPVQGALIGGGATAAGLLAPRVVQSLMNSPAGQAYLTKGLIALTPAEQAAINALTRSGATGLLGYTAQ